MSGYENPQAASGAFANLPGAVDQSAAYAPLRADETAFQADEELSNKAALSLVIQDVTIGLNFLQTKQIVPVLMDTCDQLVRAQLKPRFWSDGSPKANMPFYTVMEAIEKLMPIFYMSLFGTGKRRPFDAEPKGKTTPEAARAKASVLNWCIRESQTKEEMRLCLKTLLTYGFGVVQDSWETYTHKKRTTIKEGDKVKRGWKNIEINLPKVSNINLRQVIFDPKCDRQNVANGGAKWICKQVMVTANILHDWREDLDTYGVDEIDEEGNPTGKKVSRIPSDEDLKAILSDQAEPTEDSMLSSKQVVWAQNQAMKSNEENTADPLSQDLEYLEYWTDDWVIGVLQRKIPIRKQRLGAEFKGHSFRSCAFIDVLGSAWGFGVARLLAGDQKFQTGVGNNYINSLALVLNPAFQLVKGLGVGTQNINLSPGKVLNLGGELKPLVVPDVSATAMNAIEVSNEWASKRVGANGGSGMPTQAMRTGTGVNTVNGDITQRIQYYLEIFINLIYLPTLESMLRIAMEKLEPEQIQFILTEEEGKAWEGDITDVYNAELDIDVIAGADLMAKQAAAQLIPVLVQLVASSPVQDSFTAQKKKFNYTELITEGVDIMGWDINTLIEEATDDDIQRAMLMKQAVAKASGDQALEQQKHQNDMELASEKGYIQATTSILKETAKTHLDVAAQALQNEGEEPGETAENPNTGQQ